MRDWDLYNKRRKEITSKYPCPNNTKGKWAGDHCRCWSRKCHACGQTMPKECLEALIKINEEFGLT